MHEQNAVRANDGCHIPYVPEGQNKEPWCNRKDYYSQNVLAAVDFDDMFRYMCSCWKGSAYDARVLNSVLKAHHIDFPRLPNG